MQSTKDIPYAPDHGLRGWLDLMLPDEPAGAPVVIVVHGGGLQALSKERMEGVAQFVAEHGWAAVTPNYRLLPDHPYPASLEDLLSAYRWVQASSHPGLALLDRGRVALLGASAGGYLVLAAGYLLGPEAVRAVVDIAGPAWSERYLATARRDVADARLLTQPIDLASPDGPPLLATHSRNDTVVAPEHSARMVAKVQDLGGRAELYAYDGPGAQHGIWRDEPPPLRLLEPLEAVIAGFLSRHL